MASPYTRATVADRLTLATALEEDGFSQRQQVGCMDVPRSTLRDWQQRQAQIDADPDWVAFFPSPAGEEFLHRTVVALHFVLEWVGAGGIRLASLFLELTLLDRFVAPSYGAQHGVAMALEEAVVTFGQEEGQRLGATMPWWSIALCDAGSGLALGWPSGEPDSAPASDLEKSPSPTGRLLPADDPTSICPLARPGGESGHGSHRPGESP